MYPPPPAETLLAAATRCSCGCLDPNPSASPDPPCSSFAHCSLPPSSLPCHLIQPSSCNVIRLLLLCRSARVKLDCPRCGVVQGRRAAGWVQVCDGNGPRALGGPVRSGVAQRSRWGRIQRRILYGDGTVAGYRGGMGRLCTWVERGRASPTPLRACGATRLSNLRAVAG